MKKYYVLDTNILLQSSNPKCVQITFTERESVRSALQRKQPIKKSIVKIYD